MAKLRLDCDRCDLPLVPRTASLEDPHAYALGELPGFHLVGIVVHRCTRCGIEVPSIPQAATLHRLIVRAILRKTQPLDGNEIRFFRKRLGLSQVIFAKLIGIRQESLSRIERGERGMAETTERWLRSVVAARELNPRKVALYIRRLAEGRAHEVPPRRYVMRGRRWKTA